MPDGIDSLLFVVALVSTVAITARTVATVIGQRPYQTVHTKFQRRVLWTNVVQYASMTVAGMIGQNILSAGTNMMAGDAAIFYINAHAIVAASRGHSSALPIIRLALQADACSRASRACRPDARADRAGDHLLQHRGAMRGSVVLGRPRYRRQLPLRHYPLVVRQSIISSPSNIID